MKDNLRKELLQASDPLLPLADSSPLFVPGDWEEREFSLLLEFTCTTGEFLSWLASRQLSVDSEVKAAGMAG